MDLSGLIDAATRWMERDPDPATRDLVARMIREADEDVLAEHFGYRLQFGTAGIRGALGPGPARMNRVLVRRVSAGLGDYLLRVVPGARDRGVVVGFDARHGSRYFAEDTARVLADRGLPVWLYRDVVATPRLAHAVVHLGCAAGVMVTASHNPATDNGYKVYWGSGAQIIPPHDRGISEAIDRVVEVGDLPGLDALRERGRVRTPPLAALEAYLDGVQALRVHETTGVRLVYTAMHGVGRDLVQRVMSRAGHDDLHLVADQCDPDPDFPTTRFPNPEEPGALDRAIAVAGEVGADLVLANDPDADRLAVVVPEGDGWRALSGDQVGVLLADDLLTHGHQWRGAPRMVATTVVSSSLLRQLADHHGVAYRETLTGFKWIADAAMSFEGRFVMGYEEALGYCVGSLVRDKDGISAALLVADLAAWCRSRGETLLDRLDTLYRRHGLHLGTQRSVALRGSRGRRRIAEIMDGYRGEPPVRIAGVEVLRIRDVLQGIETDVVTGRTRPLDLPRSNVVAWDLADGSRVVVRPSGTEPKLKYYFEVRERVGDDEPMARARARASGRLDRLAAEVFPGE